MKLYNTLSRRSEEFESLEDEVRMYSCGPTVYDHIHIGNLSAFIAADTLRRTLQSSGYSVHHVMNFTDVDDKTIRRSAERYTDMSPEKALKTLTEEYSTIFLADMAAIGNDVKAINFVKATESIGAMRKLILRLHKEGFAYITEDGVYFSIEKYKASGKTYGQLLKLNTENTSSARIDNDEYDKASAHDFALWKTQKDGEPAWDFEIDGHNLTGRPGWHIECSAMSATELGQPFDIHTGGVDLIFPHHENEIAQSTAGRSNPTQARFFVHNEHLLVNGKKMSKSLGNFFTLRDIQEKGYDPLSFRLMVLQSQYRSQSNFSWDNLEAAQNRLKSYQAMADLRWQTIGSAKPVDNTLRTCTTAIKKHMSLDMNTPEALACLSSTRDALTESLVPVSAKKEFTDFLSMVDDIFGLKLLRSSDITDKQKELLNKRGAARESSNWHKSDEYRDQLSEQAIGVRDTGQGQIWFRL